MPAGHEILAFGAMDGLKVASIAAAPVIAGATAVGLHKSVPDGHYAIIERFGRAKDTSLGGDNHNVPRKVVGPGSYWDIPIFRRLKVISTLDRGVSGESVRDSNEDSTTLARKVDFASESAPDAMNDQYGFFLGYLWGIKNDPQSLYRSRYRIDPEKALTEYVKGAVSTSVIVTMKAMGFSAVSKAVERQGDDDNELFVLTKGHADNALGRFGAELRALWIVDFVRTNGQMLVDAVREQNATHGSALVVPIEQQL